MADTSKSEEEAWETESVWETSFCNPEKNLDS